MWRSVVSSNSQWIENWEKSADSLDCTAVVSQYTDITPGTPAEIRVIFKKSFDLLDISVDSEADWLNTFFAFFEAPNLTKLTGEVKCTSPNKQGTKTVRANLHAHSKDSV